MPPPSPPLRRPWGRLGFGALLLSSLLGVVLVDKLSSQTPPVPDLPATRVLPEPSPAPGASPAGRRATPTPAAPRPTATPLPSIPPSGAGGGPVPQLPPPEIVTPQGTRPAPGAAQPVPQLPPGQEVTPDGPKPLPVEEGPGPRVPQSPNIPGQSTVPAIPATPLTTATVTERRGTGMGPMISVSTEVRSSRATLPKRNWIDQTVGEADSKSSGCLECHQGVEPMHKSPYVVLGCTDCHGGNARRGLRIEQAHVQPTYPEFWKTSANPNNLVQIYNHENQEFLRFINPADLRIVQDACGLCHQESIAHVSHNIMSHGAHLWGAALYNNGGFPLKTYVFGQAYGRDGAPLATKAVDPKTGRDVKVTAYQKKYEGITDILIPLPRYNITQPGNVFRTFEKGGVKPPEIGSPEPIALPGKPERALSERGFGTRLRTDPTALGAQKTRLNDPLLPFPGTNDHAGDYRQSGCTACHTVYANDRSPTNSGWYAKFGNQGLSFTNDPTIRKNERAHPISHQFTRTIPSSMCMSCHMHQGNLFVNPYLGYVWWDQEIDGDKMYPKKQKNPTDEELVVAVRQNPELAAARGLWGDLGFLDKVSELNPGLKHTQFADYHGHGWVFRAIFKKDKKGTLMDQDDVPIRHDDPAKFQKAVHLKDIHLANGMQCMDCHFLQDVHGDGRLFTEARNATSIACIDCHGTIDKRPTLVTTNTGGKVSLAESVTTWGARFWWEEEQEPAMLPPKDNQPAVQAVDNEKRPLFRARRVLYQRSAMDPNMIWEVPQTMDTVDPSYTAPYRHRPMKDNGRVVYSAEPRPHYNAKSAYSKTLHRDGVTWGDIPARADQNGTLAHSHEKIECQICHTSWATSCFGCHLPMRANTRTPQNKFEGTTSRNFVSYNPQVVRDDVFMLGIDGTVKQKKLAVVRSSSAVLVGSQNSNREWIYSQQQTISWEGYSGQAFNPHFAHTTSSVNTTKNCTDCHLSKAGDNNAWVAQLLGFGTGTVNFFGRYAYVGAEKHGLYGVVWTEREEPQAPIGSRFQEIAYPDNFRNFVEKDHRELKEAYEHHGEVLDLTLRGEFVYTAAGKRGLEVYDVAQIDNKGFSERIVNSPNSPLGEYKRVPTKGIATSVAIPSTLAIDPSRKRNPDNEEQPIRKIYGYMFGTDTVEGLVVSDVRVLYQGQADNRFLKKDATYNPGAIDDKGGKGSAGGLLTGATFVWMAGERLYITSPQGLFVINVSEPLQPRLVGQYRGPYLRNPRAVSVQFQYAYVTDDEGFKAFDISNPDRPVPTGGVVRLRDAKRFYLARTFAYVANGKEGLAIIDIEQAAKPRLQQMYNAGGQLNDTHAVQVGSVAASMYAIVADGHNGMRVLSLITPDTVPGHMGFTPPPSPRLIATFHAHGHEIVAVSRGLDRDRTVDETGGQTVVYGRRGSRPFVVSEMNKFIRHRNGAPYRVEDVRLTAPQRTGRGVLVTASGARLAAPLTWDSRTAPNAMPPVNPLIQPDVDRLRVPPPQVPPSSLPPAPLPGPQEITPDGPRPIDPPPAPRDPTSPPPRTSAPPPAVPPARTVPLPAVTPTPRGGAPANPFLQQNDADRLNEFRRRELEQRQREQQGQPSTAPPPIPEATVVPPPKPS